MDQRMVITENIVAATAPALRQMAARALEAGVTRLQLDLERVQDLDSVGLSVLIGIAMSLQRLGGRLEVLNVRDEVFEILHSMRLDRHFHVQRLGTGQQAPTS